jgi:hypothetical protein
MRSFFVLALLLLAASRCLANEIDQLHSRSDVTTFLHTRLSKESEQEVFFDPTVSDTAAFGRNQFFKRDLDANGSTDLVVNGRTFFAVTDEGAGKYRVHFIDRGSLMTKHYTLRSIISQRNAPLLVVDSHDIYRLPDQATVKPDTLALKFGDFMEYHPVPTPRGIRQIHFSTSGCYGTCPVFDLVILADGTATYNAIKFNKKKGKFKTTLDTASYNTLVATLDYLRPSSLKDSYRVNWTDDQTVVLEVTFQDGQVKKIRDYGGIGTFGLKNLYAQFFKLRETQSWK